MRLKAIICLCLVAGPMVADPLFEPVEMPEHRYTGGWEHYVGGGLAVMDCNGDALPDLFAAGGSSGAILLRNTTMADGPISFADATPEALNITGVTGAYPLDINSDGYMDLVLLRVGENRLMQGGPDCHFTPFTSLKFISDDKWTTAFSATWEQGQTLPVLAFGNYVDRRDANGPFKACDDNDLFRPTGSGYSAATPLKPGFCALSMLFSDWGRTGRVDLRISNDRHYYVTGGQEQLWQMGPSPRLYTKSDGWQDHQLWGMGIAVRDLNGDGRQEVFLSSMGDQRLQYLTGDGLTPHFKDVPYELGTSAHRPFTGGDGRPSTGWHISFGDVNNDGRDDVFLSKGNVEQMPGSAMDDPNNLLMQDADGVFREFGDVAGIASLHRSRGAALADLDLDGRLDLVVVNRRAPLQVWRNVTKATGHWVALSLAQPGPNPNGVGGWIEVGVDGKTQSREITVGGGHASGQAGPQHFGLGAADQVKVRVVWPDSATSSWVDVAADQILTLTRQGVEFSASQ